MRAAILERTGQPLILSEVAVPHPARGELLVRLKTCGICHSDVHIWNGDVVPRSAPQPFILGHEGVGSVVAIGDAVTGWALGDPVGVPWIHETCRTCDECRDEEESFCQNQKAHGLDVPGAFCEYVVVKNDFAVRLQQGMDPALTAPVMCAGVTAYGGLKRGRLQKGETCIVFGCGGLGLYAVQLAARLGAEVVAVDRDAKKLDLATTYGAARTVIAGPDLAERLSGAKAHLCINFAPTTATWRPMLNAIRPRGRIIAAAMVGEEVPISQEWLTGTGVTITGTSVGTLAEMAEVLAIHADRPLQTLVEPIPLEDASDALATLQKGEANGRFVIRF